MKGRPHRRSGKQKGDRPGGGAWLDCLDEVERLGDRRATLPLLDHFLATGSLALDDDRAAEVADVLTTLEDPRCGERLLAAALDPARPSFRRALAVQVLAAVPLDDPPRERCLAWVADSDPVLRTLGVQYLDAQDGNRIAALVADPDVLVRRTATEALGALVRTPPLVAALRRALRDEDAVVREIACRVAMFDEPLDAARDLLRALNDPSRAVRCYAAEALAWYPRVAVLLALADARSSSGDGSPAADLNLDGAIETLVRRVVTMRANAPAAVAARIERWAAPVKWIIDAEVARLAAAVPDADGSAAPGTAGVRPFGDEAEQFRARREAARSRRPPVDLVEATRRLSDPETPLPAIVEVLHRRTWKRAGAKGRQLLSRCAESPSFVMREFTARPFVELNAHTELRALAFDRESVVRRTAFLAAVEGGIDALAAVIDGAREVLLDPAARPTAGDPALAVVSAWGDDDEIARYVVSELSRPHDGDGLYLGAIHLARFAGVTSAIPALLSIVNAPIVGAVRTHIAALETLRSLGHPTTRIDLKHLADIDHLDIVTELAHWRFRGSRW